MKIRTLLRASAAMLVAVGVAGPAAALPMMGGGDSTGLAKLTQRYRMNGLLVRYDSDAEFVRRIRPLSNYALTKLRLGESWTELRDAKLGENGPQPSFGGKPEHAVEPKNEPKGNAYGVYGKPGEGPPEKLEKIKQGGGGAGGYGGPRDHVGAVPEPSGALLLALGMTLTGAHLRRTRR